MVAHGHIISVIVNIKNNAVITNKWITIYKNVFKTTKKYVSIITNNILNIKIEISKN